METLRNAVVDFLDSELVRMREELQREEAETMREEEVCAEMGVKVLRISKEEEGVILVELKRTWLTEVPFAEERSDEGYYSD